MKAKNNTTRRQFLSTTGAAVAASAVVAVPTIADGSSGDPLPALWQRWQDVHARYKAHEALWLAKEKELDAQGLFMPRVQIATYWETDGRPNIRFAEDGTPSHPGQPVYAHSENEVLNLTGSSDEWKQRRVAEFREHAAQCRAARDESGLSALYAESEKLDDELAAIGEAIEAAEPSTFAGLAAKLRYAFEHIGNADRHQQTDEDADYDVLMMRRVIADAERLAGKGGAA